MRSVNARRAGHPSSRTLALYSRSDLTWLGRWQIGRHVAKCAYCEEQVAGFRSACNELKREAETQTLTGFEAITDWTRLEREMIGNIAVGVADQPLGGFDVNFLGESVSENSMTVNFNNGTAAATGNLLTNVKLIDENGRPLRGIGPEVEDGFGGGQRGRDEDDKEGNPSEKF